MAPKTLFAEERITHDPGMSGSTYNLLKTIFTSSSFSPHRKLFSHGSEVSPIIIRIVKTLAVDSCAEITSLRGFQLKFLTSFLLKVAPQCLHVRLHGF